MTTILNVKFLSQNDNVLWQGVPGEVQCAPTSYAALAFFLAPDKFPVEHHSEPETYYKQQFESLGYSADDRGNHSCHVETLRLFGVTGQFTTEATLADVTRSIDNGKPVVLPVNYKRAGHVMLAVGYSSKGLIVNDCYGIRSGAEDWYGVINSGQLGDEAGKHDLYSWQTLDIVAFGCTQYCWAFLPD